MQRRPRIDLDGVALSDGRGAGGTLAVLRYRTVEGLVLSMPESADITVPWCDIDDARLDLQHGTVTIVLSEAFAARANWLGETRELRGQWLDRLDLRESDLR